jgi:hypothetical protein
MSDSQTPPTGSISPERIQQLRDALRQRPMRCRPPLAYPPNPGLGWVDRLP